MIALILEHSGLVGLVAFFCFFVFTGLRLFGPGMKKKYDDFAHIPFVEDSRGE